MLTPAQLKSIMPNCASARMATCLQPLNEAMHRFRVDTPLRAAAFVAQLAHESGEFRWLEELWGPTPAQRRYEPASSLAAQLGNTRPGDGRRFKGRGPIQITGRANYARYGGLLGVDLVAEPEQAADPGVGFAIAGLYWASNHLNELADAGKFVAITRRINGGTNGLADREKYYARAKETLAGGVFGDEPPRPRGALGIELTVPLDDLPPLPRGGEALRAAARADAAADAAPSHRAARPEAAVGGTASRVTPRKAAGASRAPAAGTTSAERTGAAKTSAGKAQAAAQAASASAAGATKTTRGLAAGTANTAAQRLAAGTKTTPAKRTAGVRKAAVKRSTGTAPLHAKDTGGKTLAGGADPTAAGSGEDAASVREAVAARQRKAARPARRSPAAAGKAAARRPGG